MRKRAYFKVSEELLAQLFKLKEDISITAVRKDMWSNDFDVYVNGYGLPETSNRLESEVSKQIDLKEVSTLL